MHGRPGQLPGYESNFVGREREIADLRHLLSTHRLVSICGRSLSMTASAFVASRALCAISASPMKS